MRESNRHGPLTRFALLTACLAGSVIGCASAQAGEGVPAAAGDGYGEMAAWYGEASFYLGIDACDQAMVPLDLLVEHDRDLEFPLAYRLLEECHTKEGRHDDARLAYRAGRERARAHTDERVRGLAEVFDEWAHRYEVFLETGERVVSWPDVFPSAVDGEQGLRRQLVLPDTMHHGGFEGEVRIQTRVDENGDVLHAFIQSSSGIAAYDRAALAAVRAAAFVPARIGDRPIRAWISVPIVF